MTTLSKCFVVFALVASLAFLGFAAAVRQGGQNYKAQINGPDLRGYVFETTVGVEQTTYGVRVRAPQAAPAGEGAEAAAPAGESLANNNPVLADVIVKAREDLKRKQEDELQKISRELDGYEENGRKVLGLRDKITRAEKQVEEDIQAMKKREDLLRAELQKMQQAISGLSDEAQKKSQNAQQLQNEATRRREDVGRLKNQLEELQTDKYRAMEQEKKLKDLLRRLKENVDRMERRNAQLK